MKYKIFVILTFITVLVFAGVNSTSVQRPVEEKEPAYWVTDTMSKSKFNLSIYTFNGNDYISMKLIVPEGETTSSVHAPAGYYFNDDSSETNIFELVECSTFSFVEKNEDVSIYYLEFDAIISIASSEGIKSYLSISDEYQDNIIHWNNITSVECNMYYSTENKINSLDFEEIEVEPTFWDNLSKNQLLTSVVVMVGVVGGLTTLMIFTKHRSVKTKES